MKEVYIVIPALEPSEDFPGYIRTLRQMIRARTVVIDDGSGEKYAGVFQEIEAMPGCRVLHHSENQGKGRALKTGFRYIRDHSGEDSLILCADCDGQHLPEDGLKLIKAAEEYPGEMVLGVRDFSEEWVPWKSRFGNRISSRLFRFFSGAELEDTQTGFRAFGGELLDLLLDIPGERFEYELRVLLACVERRIPLRTVTIRTVYLNDNRGTHFHPLRDSVQVTGVMLSTGTHRKRNFWFMLTILTSSVYLFWRIFFTIPWEDGLFQAAAGIILVLAETVTFLGTAELMISRMKSARYEIPLPAVQAEDFPDVDVLIATHNEPAELLYKTINACTFLKYPDRSKVHIYVCDDGNRQEIRALAEAFGVGYLGPAENEHAKAGNYNHALSCTSSPLVATFDADMIPRSIFLLRTVPYFFIPDSRIGLVQTPQSFYNQDLFQFNLFSEKDIPNEQDFFSREINVLRNATNTAAYTGSNTVILRTALEEIGGFPYDTVTEDFEVSIRLQKAGYITYASSEVLAAGLSTTTVPAMIRQRIRWARGVIQSIRNTNAVFTGQLSLAARISYLNAFFYWWSFFCRLVFILAPILFALCGVRLADCGFGELLLFWLPAHLSYRVSVKYLSTNIRNARWSRIIDTILAPYLVIPVLLESVGIHKREFHVTGKERQKGRTVSAWYLIPHGILIFLSIVAVLTFIRGKYGMALVYSSVILYWLGYNLTALLYAVFFMSGRTVKRVSDRIGARIQVEIGSGEDCCAGKTVDVSEEGVAMRVEGPFRPDKGSRFRITADTGEYRAELGCLCVHCRREKDGSLFLTGVVSPLNEEDRRQWLQIIHDREHSLPKEIDPWMTVYDEIDRNIKRRLPDSRKRDMKS